jgi:hypothetical protein
MPVARAVESARVSGVRIKNVLSDAAIAVGRPPITIYVNDGSYEGSVVDVASVAVVSVGSSLNL